MKTCPDCNGEGVIEKGTDDEQQCPTCGGSGFVPNDDDDHEEVIRTAGGFPFGCVKNSITFRACVQNASIIAFLRIVFWRWAAKSVECRNTNAPSTMSSS
jgi:RecJ-like exonuclease